MAKYDIKKGVGVLWNDPDTGELLSGVVIKHIVSMYWTAKLKNSKRAGKLRDIDEKDIVSIRTPETNRQAIFENNK